MNYNFSFPLNYGLSKTGLPLILVRIGDNDLCFILDTGSTNSLIDSNVVECFRNIVEPAGEYCISGIEGTKHKVEMITLPITVEGQKYKPQFCVKPLFDTFSGIEMESGIQVHGLLGSDFMLENKWIINFEELKVYSN